MALAHGLGYSVVAEGVQDMDTLHFLRSRGCDIIQGYLFCPALRRSNKLGKQTR
ncbi:MULTISPECIES: EAL domain-containing protein [Vibrio]|uniref:EAL domain-containing protein n=1 Tax=Vibrio TaxID=662 RepID=UPI0021CE83CA|nr:MULTISPECIES: EAL domain-containing protein [Vibrio]MDG2627490.1 EAL domain-containing protein [Vibrio parahaemolyticus]MDL0444065.1 EAL domain-containing protein [Vibrio alginolyticus]MDM4740948.1 EAL domain-containing protein [Vibrio alginolyticus]MDM4761304.1 EAL domain-containing protein [Vibrio alginolyticus]MDN8583142.1 EAL domain-containing protein [Vibrio alginolyticus]